MSKENSNTIGPLPEIVLSVALAIAAATLIQDAAARSTMRQAEVDNNANLFASAFRDASPFTQLQQIASGNAQMICDGKEVSVVRDRRVISVHEFASTLDTKGCEIQFR